MTNLLEYQKTVRDINEANGWFESDRSFGDDMALLHSEISEAFEAFRDWGTVDKTIDVCEASGKHVGEHLCKPEGVGSEFADILIRLLDTCERYGYDIAVKTGLPPIALSSKTFGDAMTALHGAVSMWYAAFVGDMEEIAQQYPSVILEELKHFSTLHGVDLFSELDRKIEFNKTRGHRHGGKRV